MIQLSDIIRAIADAIESDATVKDLTQRWVNGYRLLVGHTGDGELQQEDERCLIAIGFSDTDYNLGYAATRAAPIQVRVSAWAKAMDNDGIREEYNAVLDVADLLHRLAEVVKEITGMGNDLTIADMRMDTEQWPFVAGTLSVSIEWPVGLNAEATL